MILTAENYFSPEANREYMSCSQWKAFRACPARALADLRGEYVRPDSTALLVGSYVDSHFEGTLDVFKAQHPELFKRDGTLKSEYQQANVVIDRMEADELFSMLMSGGKQVIRTGEIAGVPFKIKIDSLLDAETVHKIVKRFPEAESVLSFCDGAIVDLKCMRDCQDVWSDDAHAKIPFVEAWGYQYQGGIYRAVEGNSLPFILAVGTKENAVNTVALHIPQSDLDAALAEVEDSAPEYAVMKRGEVAAPGCGHCDYCRSVKKLDRIIDYREAAEC